MIAESISVLMAAVICSLTPSRDQMKHSARVEFLNMRLQEETADKPAERFVGH
jgi:hypothetical protein